MILCFLCSLSRWHLCVWAGQGHVWWLSDCENLTFDTTQRPSSFSPVWLSGCDQTLQIERFIINHTPDFALQQSQILLSFKTASHSFPCFGGEIKVEVSGVRHLIGFSHLYNLITWAKVNHHRQAWWRGICSVYLSMTEQLSCRIFFFPVILSLSYSHTHTFTRKATWRLSVSISPDRKRWETERDCQHCWEASSFFTLVFLNNIWSSVLMLF